MSANAIEVDQLNHRRLATSREDGTIIAWTSRAAPTKVQLNKIEYSPAVTTRYNYSLAKCERILPHEWRFPLLFPSETRIAVYRRPSIDSEGSPHGRCLQRVFSHFRFQLLLCTGSLEDQMLQRTILLWAKRSVCRRNHTSSEHSRGAHAGNLSSQSMRREGHRNVSVWTRGR